MALRFRSFVPRTHSPAIFALVMGCYCSTVSAFVSTWAYAARLPHPPRAFYLRGDAPDVLALLVFAPLIESLIVVGVFELLPRAHAPKWIQIVVPAIFIAELHVSPWWPHAFIVLPSFLIQIGAYSYWRHAGWKQAYWVLVSIHALNNVIPAVSAFGRALRHA